MGIGGKSVFLTDQFVTSDALRRFVDSVSDVAIATFSCTGNSVTLSTFAGNSENAFSRSNKDAEIWLREPLSHVSNVALQDISRNEILALDMSSGRKSGRYRRRWHGLVLQLQNGATDRIALRLNASEEVELTSNYLGKVWPILRENCLREALETCVPTSGDDAFHTMILDRIDVALIILDAHCLMYRVNAAARQLLEEGQVLRRARGGIFASGDADSRAFRAAVCECAGTDNPQGVDTVLFVSRKGCNQRVPVTLSRYYYNGLATRFVVAMLPMPPERKRVEDLVQKMGLTPAEARVAALMQLGLTNKEAAAQGGFKEQTFNTYAKRVFSKLDVSGRTEMAQLLTWQAAGGRTL